MKTILVATDFSEAAENAVQYAAEIAKAMRAKLILFHAFHVPVVATEAPFVIPDIYELEEDFMDDLKKVALKLHEKHGYHVSIECVSKYGLAVDEINLYAKNNKIDLVVMGMQGAGYVSERLFGSITTAVIRKARIPVLVIGKKVKYRVLKKIALACDYAETENKMVFEPLKEFIRLYHSHLYILNVIGKPEPLPATQKVVSDFMKLEQSLVDVNHTFHYNENKDVVAGINDFINEGQMDMVVMIPRKHTILQNIFNEPNTKKMAFHAAVPLLALH